MIGSFLCLVHRLQNKWVMKSLWSRGQLRSSLPSPAVAFQQLMASFEHQSLSLLVLCMKYYDFDLITLFMPVCASAPLVFFNYVSFQRELNSRGGISKAIVKWQDREASRTGTSPRPRAEQIDFCGSKRPVGINPSGLWVATSVAGGDHFEKGLFVPVTSHM